MLDGEKEHRCARMEGPGHGPDIAERRERYGADLGEDLNWTDDVEDDDAHRDHNLEPFRASSSLDPVQFS